PGADVAPDENHDEIVRAPSSADRALAPGGDGELAGDPERRPRSARLQQLDERDVAPAERRRAAHQALLAVDEPGNAEPHRLHFRKRHSGGAARRLRRSQHRLRHLRRLLGEQAVLSCPSTWPVASTTAARTFTPPRSTPRYSSSRFMTRR